MFLENSQNSQENICARVFFNKVAGLRPEEFCEISKNTCLTEHLWTTASENLKGVYSLKILAILKCENRTSLHAVQCK